MRYDVCVSCGDPSPVSEMTNRGAHRGRFERQCRGCTGGKTKKSSAQLDREIKASLLGKSPSAHATKAQGARPLVESIQPGDRVTIVDRFGKQHTGRAVMRGPHGWVLNMGGAHGRPGIATDDNTVKVSCGKKSTRQAHSTKTTGEARAEDLDRQIAPTLGKSRAQVVRAINAITRAADGRNVYLLRERLGESQVRRITRARTKGRGMEVHLLDSGNWIGVLPELGDRIDVR